MISVAIIIDNARIVVIFTCENVSSKTITAIITMMKSSFHPILTDVSSSENGCFIPDSIAQKYNPIIIKENIIEIINESGIAITGSSMNNDIVKLNEKKYVILLPKNNLAPGKFGIGIKA